MNSLFFRISGKRLLVVALLALIAGAVTGVILYRQPAQYRAEAVVFPRRLFPHSVPDYELSPIADDVVATMTTTPVVSAASDASGVPAPAIRDGLDVARIETSGNVNVAFQSTSGHDATTVVEAISRGALRRVADDDLRKAQTAVQQAQDESALAEARARENDARAELAAVDSDAVLAVREASQTSRLTETARGVVSAVVVAAALGLMVLVAFQRNGRTRATFGELEPRAPTARRLVPAVVDEVSDVGAGDDADPVPVGIHWRPNDQLAPQPNGGPTAMPRSAP